MENSEDQEHGEQGGGIQIEQLKSYLAFGRRALRAHLRIVASVVAIGLILTGLANAFIPRKYRCTTVLMALSNPILEGGTNNYNPLNGASGLVLSHENLEKMIRDIGLVAKAEVRRPPLSHLKDQLFATLSGPPTEKTKVSILVGTLENKLQINGTGLSLTIDAEWSDAQTAAEVAQSASESFLNARHTAEVSAFEEKVTILDEHATKLREEIEQLAQQINNQSERAVAQPGAEVAAPPTGGTPTAIRHVLRVAAAPRGPVPPDAELPALKEDLAAAKVKLAALESDRERQEREESQKLADLKLRFTPAHPQVVMQEERVALASGVSADQKALAEHVSDLTKEVKTRELAAARASGEPVAVRTAAGTAEPLPPAVVQALQTGDTDQALAQQLSGAVVRYGILRDDIGAGRIALDTAQAAFNHRYRVIVPVEAPSKPTSPKAIVIWGAGIVVTFLLALLLPLVSELRKGILVERWQAEQLQLPILAELHLPTQSE